MHAINAIKYYCLLFFIITPIILSGCKTEEEDDQPTPTPTTLEGVDFTGDNFVSITPTPSPSPVFTPSATATPAEATFVLTGPTEIIVNSLENYTVEVTALPDGTSASFALFVPSNFAFTNLSSDIGEVSFENSILLWTGQITGTPANITFTLSVDTAGAYTLDPISQPGSNTTSFNLLVLAAPTPTPTPTPILLTNGSFEGTQLDERTDLYPSDTNLLGWQITGVAGLRSIAWHYGPIIQHGGYTAANGDYFLAFNGGDEPARGGIKQTITTKQGENYKLSLSVGRIGATTLALSLTTDIVSDGIVFLSTKITPTTLGWSLPTEISFTAPTDTTEVRIYDTSTGTIGEDIILDNVKIEVVP